MQVLPGLGELDRPGRRYASDHADLPVRQPGVRAGRLHEQLHGRLAFDKALQTSEEFRAVPPPAQRLPDSLRGLASAALQPGHPHPVLLRRHLLRRAQEQHPHAAGGGLDHPHHADDGGLLRLDAQEHPWTDKHGFPHRERRSLHGNPSRHRGRRVQQRLGGPRPHAAHTAHADPPGAVGLHREGHLEVVLPLRQGQERRA
mmetsp:Transcript_13395/g.41486  ORF Transcript_13395/g.41486 Transcript_13395/m.41486 type:complete len:201 (+) Transcript_13395:100-702(+)